MARIRAYGQIDMDRIDFGGFYASRFTASFLNDVVPMDNGEYWDGWEVISGDRTVALGFIGPAVGYDYDALSLTGGRFETVQVLDAVGYVPGEVEIQYRLRWLFEDVPIPALDLWRAVNTASVADDRALLRRALDGNDVLVLSPGADRTWGHDGADRVEGRGGRDRLGDEVVLRGDVTGDRRVDFAVELSGLDRLGASDLLL